MDEVNETWKNEKRRIAKNFFESALSDIESGLLLFKYDDEFRYFFNSLISFCIALEKLTKANLFLHSPLHLKKEINHKDLLNFKKNPRSFGERFIQDHQHNFIGLDEAWNRLVTLDESFNEYDLVVSELAKARNHHLHTFAKQLTTLTMKLLFVKVWSLLNVLHREIEEQISATTVKNIGDALEDGMLDHLNQLVEEFEPSVEFEERRSENLKWLRSQKKPISISDFVAQTSHWNGEHIIGPIKCPVCNEESGHVGCYLEEERRTDSEGDLVAWEPPSGFSAEFTDFICLSCGAYFDSMSTLESIDIDVDLDLPSHLTFRWDINEGISNVSPSYTDRKGYAGGMPVDWF